MTAGGELRDGQPLNLGNYVTADTTQPLGSRRDAPDMRQPPRLLSQPRLGLAPCTLRQNPAHSRQLTSHSTMTQPPRSL